MSSTRHQWVLDKKQKHGWWHVEGKICSLYLTHSEGNHVSTNKITAGLCARLRKRAGMLPCLMHWPAHQGEHCGKSIWIIHTPNDVTHTHIYYVQNRFIFVSKLEVKVPQTKPCEPRGKEGQREGRWDRKTKIKTKHVDVKRERWQERKKTKTLMRLTFCINT